MLLVLYAGDVDAYSSASSWPVIRVFWIVVVAFCGYIGYDWAIAQRRRRTVDAAVDSACALYLDIINVFIRLLAIAGRRSRK